MRFRLITASGVKLMSEKLKPVLPPEIAMAFDILISELDPSGLSGSDLPFIKYESRGYQILILPPMEGELGREVETSPVADTDDHRF